MTNHVSNRHETRRVQSAITSVSFPPSLERLRAMGTKWLKHIGTDLIMDMDVLLDFPTGTEVPWIAPKWMTSGDLLFFYHTKTAAKAIKMRLAEARSEAGKDIKDLPVVIKMLKRASTLADEYSGKIFAVAEVSGTPVREYDENKHFKGTIYAPISSVHVFDRPASAEEFNSIVRIGQNTITPVYGHQLEKLKELFAVGNQLPEPLAMAMPTDLSFRDVTRHNWIEIACDRQARFVNEAQLRAYFLDYLLGELKDSRTPVYKECNCYRDGERTGVADYFIKFGGEWLPVEAKLNIVTEPNLQAQLQKYLNVECFAPTLEEASGQAVTMAANNYCLVADQAGVYLTEGGRFMGCSQSQPLLRREDIDLNGIAGLRTRLFEVMGRV